MTYQVCWRDESPELARNFGENSYSTGYRGFVPAIAKFSSNYPVVRFLSQLYYHIPED